MTDTNIKLYKENTPPPPAAVPLRYAVAHHTASYGIIWHHVRRSVNNLYMCTRVHNAKCVQKQSEARAREKGPLHNLHRSKC